MQFNHKICPAKFRSRNESFGFQSPAHGGSEVHFVPSYFQLSVFLDFSSFMHYHYWYGYIVSIYNDVLFVVMKTSFIFKVQDACTHWVIFGQLCSILALSTGHILSMWLAYIFNHRHLVRFILSHVTFQLSVFWTLAPLCIIIIGMDTLYPSVMIYDL